MNIIKVVLPLFLVACSSFVLAEETAKERKITLKLDGHVSGPELSEETIKDKVVVLQQWHAHCQRCTPYIKKFDKLMRRQKNNEEAAFLIWHSMDKADLAQKKAKELRLKGSIYQGNTIGWDKEKFGERVWPDVIILDRSGEVAYMGELNAKFKKALKETIENE